MDDARDLSSRITTVTSSRAGESWTYSHASGPDGRHVDEIITRGTIRYLSSDTKRDPSGAWIEYARSDAIRVASH